MRLFEERAKYAHALAGTTYLAAPTSPPTRYSVPEQVDPDRRGSEGSVRTTSITRIRTRSIGGPLGGGGVIFERDPESTEPNDDEIIIVTVKCNTKLRRNSYDEDLPERPPRRGFMRRLSTRLMSPADEGLYKAVKMPRGEYKRYFARDRDGGYAGTEPERDWEESEVMSRYARYQDLPLRSILL